MQLFARRPVYQAVEMHKARFVLNRAPPTTIHGCYCSSNSMLTFILPSTSTYTAAFPWGVFGIS